MRLRRSSSAQNITSMPQTAQEEREERMRNYTIAMAIRTACFLALIWVRGPWMLLFAAGAIFLPYIAVVLANHVRRRGAEDVARPAGLEPLRPAGEAPGGWQADGAWQPGAGWHAAPDGGPRFAGAHAAGSRSGSAEPGERRKQEAA